MIQMKTPLLAVGLVAAALFVPAAAQDEAPAAEKFTFKLDLAKGEKFAFRQTMDMNQDLDMGSMQVSTVVAMTSDYTYEVTDVAANGDMSLTIRFGRIKGTFENPMMGSLEFDSDGETAETGNPMVDMMGKMFTANAGQQLTMVMNPTGDVVSVEGVEELVDRMLEDNPMAGMGGALDAEKMTESMTDNFEGQLGQIPPKPVAVGDSWSTDRGMSAMGGMGLQMSITSTLRGLDATEAEIESEITGELSGGQLAAMFTVDEFTGSSRTTISVKDGLPLVSTATMNMTATMDAGPQGQGGMVMTVETRLERIAVTSSPVTPSGTDDGEEPVEPPQDE